MPSLEVDLDMYETLFEMAHSYDGSQPQPDSSRISSGSKFTVFDIGNDESVKQRYESTLLDQIPKLMATDYCDFYFCDLKGEEVSREYKLLQRMVIKKSAEDYQSPAWYPSELHSLLRSQEEDNEEVLSRCCNHRQ